MKEIEIKGQAYKIGKLSAMKQMLILKRATAILGAMQSIFSDYDREHPEKSLAALGEAVSALPDESVKYIVGTCLDSCKRKESGGGWAPVSRNGELMYQDMDLITMLSLVSHTLMANLKGFFQDLPSIAPAGAMMAKE